MPISAALRTFHNGVAQCNSLIANANIADSSGSPLLPKLDRDQISDAAFLNFFRAWEQFLESTLLNFMIGAKALNGTTPSRFVAPPDLDAASRMLKGTQRYFDFGNQDFFRLMVNQFFDAGYPYEPYLSSITSTLSDIRTARNSCAHNSSSTQNPLESLALRLLGVPYPGINVSDLLVATMPGIATGATVFYHFQSVLMSAADAISTG